MSFYLLPNTFYDEQPIDTFVPTAVSQILLDLSGIIGESERATRRYLIKVLKGNDHARALPIHLLNEHTKHSEMQVLAETIAKGGKWALLSDAGISCIADPGSSLVRALHQLEYYDIWSIGCPSSILMALQLSGLSGQSFAFHGYAPQEKEAKLASLRKWEREGSLSGMTQICIETPYRNKALLQDILETLHPHTLLSLAQEVGCPEQRVRTYPISFWKKSSFEMLKVPTVFLWQGRSS